MRLELFRMERMQSLHWHRVDYDLSESGRLPLSLPEAFGEGGEAAALLDARLGYPLSEGSEELRRRIAAFYAGAATGNVTVVNGGSEANHLVLWALAEPGTRVALMVPNYMQGWGLGRHYAGRVDVFPLRLGRTRWELDQGALARAVTRKTRVVMVCNPDNPTGSVLNDDERTAIVAAARRVGAWILADEIYRGAELAGEALTASLWGRYPRVAATGGPSQALRPPR